MGRSIAALLVMAAMFGCKNRGSNWCEKLEAALCTDLVQSVRLEDQMTVAMAMVTDSDPDMFLEAGTKIAAIAPAEKKAALIAELSKAKGAPTSCPALDAAWDSKPSCFTRP